jgi:hypothetical protein
VSYTSSLITELRGLGDLSYISFFCLLGTARFEIGCPSAILVNILDGCGSTMKNRRGQEVIFPFLHLLIQTPLLFTGSYVITDVNYYLDKLPDGYGLFETERPGGEGQAYKRLFGHPTGRYYDSAKRSEVHFLWLMSGTEGGCECVLCSGKKPPVVRRPDAFRFDQTMLGRSEGRTQSKDMARLKRDDSSMLHLLTCRSPGADPGCT